MITVTGVAVLATVVTAVIRTTAVASAGMTTATPWADQIATTIPVCRIRLRGMMMLVAGWLAVTAVAGLLRFFAGLTGSRRQCVPDLAGVMLILGLRAVIAVAELLRFFARLTGSRRQRVPGLAGAMLIPGWRAIAGRAVRTSAGAIGVRFGRQRRLWGGFRKGVVRALPAEGVLILQADLDVLVGLIEQLGGLAQRRAGWLVHLRPGLDQLPLLSLDHLPGPGQQAKHRFVRHLGGQVEALVKVLLQQV